MTDLEISKQLALAIGWKEHQVILEKRSYGTFCLVDVVGAPFANWKCFDYRDWTAIAPSAERYNKFPYMHRGKDGLLDGKWVVWPGTLENTPQKAIAMAVINGATE